MYTLNGKGKKIFQLQGKMIHFYCHDYDFGWQKKEPTVDETAAAALAAIHPEEISTAAR